jgi:hypothetical protein
VCSAATDTRRTSESDSSGIEFAYVAERLRAHIQADRCESHEVDPRLTRFFETPTVADMFHQRERHEGHVTQFIHQEAPKVTALDVHPDVERDYAADPQSVAV